MIKEFKNTSRAFFNPLNEPQVDGKNCFMFNLHTGTRAERFKSTGFLPL